MTPPDADPARLARLPPGTLRAVESPDFPFESLSRLCALESWRKEVGRPIYHVHKWWAQRLGSAFRAAIIAAAAPEGADLEALFRGPVRLEGQVVFDPFSGSGTTAGETLKLGGAAVALDINPVAVRATRVGLGPLDRDRLLAAFERVRAEVEEPERALHRTEDGDEALYWFWVKQLPCPSCELEVDLFSTRIFARHANPSRHPRVHATCPNCQSVVEARHGDADARCPACAERFALAAGPVQGAKMRCPRCSEFTPMVEAARRRGAPPGHRLYAKLVLDPEGAKRYRPIGEEDRALYAGAERALAAEDLVLPNLPIEAGINTLQIARYGYVHWRQAFNARQLLGLGRLAKAIRGLEPGLERTALGVLFSAVLEMNNQFATYKGEGTGAVRHMFSHHILKPERTPIEARPFGTPKSSGAFSTQLGSRLLRAIDYRARPFEWLPDPDRPSRGLKQFDLSAPIEPTIHSRWPQGGLQTRELLLRAGDSADSGLPDASVDLVVTDPPYFDNVHYSELADFFAAWTEAWGGGPAETTRKREEVQDGRAERFSNKLERVLAEARRVLVEDGLVVMSYQHARTEAWTALGRALIAAGLLVVQAHPIKAELSRAAPKARSKAPIDIDVFVVARKPTCPTLKLHPRPHLTAARALAEAVERAAARAQRYRAAGFTFGEGDARVLLSSQLLVTVSPGRDPAGFVAAMEWAQPRIAPLAATLLEGKRFEAEDPEAEQLDLGLG